VGHEGREAGGSGRSQSPPPPPELVRDADFFLRFGDDASAPAADPDELDVARRFRDVLGRFCTGVVVVTSMSDRGPVGMTCQSFSSVSLAPPLVLFCASRTSRSWPLIRDAGFFCVNLLHRDQQAISERMATRGADKFEGLDWKPASSGAPLIDGVAGFVDCTLEAVYRAGDHDVVIGRVQDLGHSEHDEPLLFFKGRYTALGE